MNFIIKPIFQQTQTPKPTTPNLKKKKKKKKKNLKTQNPFRNFKSQTHTYIKSHKVHTFVYIKKKNRVIKFGFFLECRNRYHRVEPYDPSTSLQILHRTQNQEPSLPTELSPIPNRGRPFFLKILIERYEI